MENTVAYSFWTPEEVARDLAGKVRQARLARNWRQSTLAERSGVTLASLRRFERTGQISLNNLLKISFALGRLDDFGPLLRVPEAGSVRELEARVSMPKPKRGTR
jgi:HTH-type transcriptional regulator / antitoxin HipB